MDWEEFKHGVKNAGLPYYLSDDDSTQIENMDYENFPSRLHHQISLRGFFLNRPSRKLLDVLNADGSLSPTRSISLFRRTPNRKGFYAGLGNMLQNFFEEGRGKTSKVNKRIKCSSLERVALDELQVFSTFTHSIKKIKKSCDLNLWSLLNQLKAMYQAEHQSSKQTFLLDIGRIMLHFVFSTVSQLRYEQCRLILEKLIKLESFLIEAFSNKGKTISTNHRSKYNPDDECESPTSKILNRAHSLLANTSEAKSETDTLLDIAPPNLFNNLGTSTNAKRKGSADEKGKNLFSLKDKQKTIKQIMLIISKIKYTVAQMGHFLHYEELSNRVAGILTKDQNKAKNEQNNYQGFLGNLVTPSHGDPMMINLLTPKDGSTNSNQRSARKELGFAEAVGSKSFGSRLLSQNFFSDSIVSSKNLKNYFYFTQNFLDDFKTDVVAKRLEQLQKYCKWKTKKWTVNHKREKMEQKYEQYKMVCKICAQQVHVDKMMDHSRLCRKKGELDKELKEFDDRMSDMVFKAVLKSKEIHTKLVVSNKKYMKLKERIHKEVHLTGTTLLTKKKSILMRTENNSFIASSEADPSLGNSMLTTLGKEASPPPGFARSATAKKDLLLNFTLDLKKSNSEESQQQKASSLTDRQQTDSSQALEIEGLSQIILPKNRSRSPPIREREEVKQVDVAPETLPIRKSKGPTILMQQDSISRRHSVTSVTEDLDGKPSPIIVVEKRLRGFQLDVCAIRRAYGSTKEQAPKDITDAESSEQEAHSATIHSARKGSTTSSQSRSSSTVSSIDFDDSQFDDLSICPIPAEFHKSKTAHHNKSSFFNLKGRTASNPGRTEDSQEEVLSRKEDEGVDVDDKGEKTPEETISLKASEEDPQSSLALRSFKKKQTLKKQDSNSSFSTEPKMDPTSLEKLRKIRQEINKIKLIASLYDIIKEKGKSLLNQPPYVKSLELSIDDIFAELSPLKSKIEDKSALFFLESFQALIKDRITMGKGFVNTKKELNKLDGVVEQEQEQHKALERTFSLMKRGSLNLPKSNMFMAGKNMARPPTSNFRALQKRPAANEIKEESGLNSSRISQESIALPPGFELSSFVNNETGFLGTQSPAHNGTPKYDLPKDKIIPSSSSSDDESNASSESDTEGSVLSGSVKRNPQKEEGKIDDAFLESLKVSPIRKGSKATEGKRDSSVLKSGKKPAIVIRDSEGKLRDSKNFGKPKKTVIFPEEKIVDQELKLPSLRPSSSAVTCSTAADTEEMFSNKPRIRKGSPFRHDLLNVPQSISEPADGITLLKEDRSNSEEAQSPKARARSKKHFTSIPNASQLPDSGFTQRLIITKGAPEGRRGRSLHGTVLVKSKGRASSTEHLREPIGPPVNQQKVLIVKDLEKAKQPTQIIAKREEKSPIKKSRTQFFAEDLLEDIEMCNDHLEVQDAPESLFLLDTILERGYYSDSQVKRIKMPITVQPLIGMNDFEPLKMISKGAFGRVWLVRRKATNDLYAMKVINLTEQFMKNKEMENLRKENKVFGLAQEDFVVRAVFTFTFETCICFVMEYMIGGDFGDILYNYLALDEDVARFYIAEIVMAVEYLHSLGIVHRDLKPDNILLDKKGHAKLTDFGLSETGLSQKMRAKNSFGEINVYQEKIQAINQLCPNNEDPENHVNLKLKGKVMEKKFDSISKYMDGREYEVESDEIIDSTSKSSVLSLRDSIVKKRNSRRHHRLIGTPDYMAPEIILGASTTAYSIDWWSLGCILFEFLVGVPPFNDDTPEKIYDNIVHERVPWDQLTIGYDEGCITPEASDLIKGLLTLDHTKRLGSNGVAEIKQHKFFKGVNWENLRRKQPPIIPEHTDETDTTNFVRLAGTISEKEDFYSFIPKDKKGASNMDAVRKYLEEASESFNMFNIAALDSDNIKSVEEALQQRDEDLKEFKKEGNTPNCRANKFCDDVFDSPEFSKH